MKKVLALAISISSFANAQHTYIIGDRLSSPTGCEWAKQLPGAIHNYAQAGLTLEAFDFPNHLKIERGGKAVVYIGTNDAGSGVPVKKFKRKLEETISSLQIRGAEVYLIAQPQVNVKLLNEFRQTTEEVAIKYSATYLDPGWGIESTVDGIHPSCLNYVYLGQWMNYMLGY